MMMTTATRTRTRTRTPIEWGGHLLSQTILAAMGDSKGSPPSRRGPVRHVGNSAVRYGPLGV